LLVAGIVIAAAALGVGIIIGHFGINKSQNYKTFISSIQATRIEENLK
jgi:hypothetical protein